MLNTFIMNHYIAMKALHDRAIDASRFFKTHMIGHIRPISLGMMPVTLNSRITVVWCHTVSQETHNDA